MLSTNKKNDETFTASKYSFQASNELIELCVTYLLKRNVYQKTKRCIILLQKQNGLVEKDELDYVTVYTNIQSSESFDKDTQANELTSSFLLGEKKMHTFDIEVNISARKKSANDIACIDTKKN